MKTPFGRFGALNGVAVIPVVTAIDDNATICVTKITASILTHANGKFFAIQDSANSPNVIAKHVDATAGAGVPSVVTWDFGGNSTPGYGGGVGISVAIGKDLNIVSEGSGPSALIYIEGYQLHSSPIPGNL